MTDKIIAFVDGSIYSESVCHHAAWIAGRTGGEVELYHVLGRREAPDRTDLSGAIRLGARTRLLEELSALDEQRNRLAQAQGRAILDDAKALVEADGAHVTPHLRRGDLVETVGELEDKAALTVIGKRGEGADFAKMHLGSNLERVARASRKPVFVASRAFKPIRKVMIAYDGRAGSMKAVDYVAREPLFAGLECLVVSVGEASDKLRRQLSDAEATLAAGGHKAETMIAGGQPAQTLGSLVESEGIDLLVMGSYGHSALRGMILGSTASEVIRTCLVPILLMR